MSSWWWAEKPKTCRAFLTIKIITSRILLVIYKISIIKIHLKESLRRLFFCELFARFLGDGWPLAARTVRAYKVDWFVPLSTSNCAEWPRQTNKAMWVARWVLLHISHGGRKAWSGRRYPSGFCRFVFSPAGCVASWLLLVVCLLPFFMFILAVQDYVCVELRSVTCPLSIPWMADDEWSIDGTAINGWT